MQWIVDNWLLVLLIGGGLGAHFFLHGRGGHGGHGHNHRGEDDQAPQDSGKSDGEIVTGYPKSVAGKERRPKSGR